MKKLIEYLVRRYNKKARPEDRIMVTKPVVFEAKKTASMNVARLSEEEPEFYNNILKEKKYDLRQELIDRIWREGNIDESVVESDNEVQISLTINIYGKHSNDGVLSST